MKFHSSPLYWLTFIFKVLNIYSPLKRQHILILQEVFLQLWSKHGGKVRFVEQAILFLKSGEEVLCPKADLIKDTTSSSKPYFSYNTESKSQIFSWSQQSFSTHREKSQAFATGSLANLCTEVNSCDLFAMLHHAFIPQNYFEYSSTKFLVPILRDHSSKVNSYLRFYLIMPDPLLESW